MNYKDYSQRDWKNYSQLLMISVICVIILVLPVAANVDMITFTSDRNGDNEIYTMNAEGTDQTRLTTNSANDWAPAYSPDGTKIAFSSSRNGPTAIYTMDWCGTNVNQITYPTNPKSNTMPSYSPDGNKIVFIENTGAGGSNINTMDADGSDIQGIYSSSIFANRPVWSPDGSRIAFAAHPGDSGPFQIYTIKPDGTDIKQLTFDDGSNTMANTWPTWSPDGSHIAFASYRDGNSEIYIMKADGTDQTRLTDNTARDDEPAWSLDLDKIAFISDRDGNLEIYVMDPDGTDLTQLTMTLSSNFEPNWGSTTTCEVPVYVDIYPVTCPNAFNTRQRGVIPVAILGTVDFDVTTIDPLVKLNGISPIRWVYKDITTPFSSDSCGCQMTGADGYLDLVLHFDSIMFAGTLSGFTVKGDPVGVEITGSTMNGLQKIKGTDCIWVTK